MLPSIVNEVLKSVVAQYNAIELIVKREQVESRHDLAAVTPHPLIASSMQVSSEVRTRLQNRAKDFFIVLDDVSIVSAA